MKMLWNSMRRFAPPRLFLHSQRGSAMPIVALGLFALMGATGVAIDMSRVQIVQSRMQNALDAAGLAAGATISTVDAQDVTEQYFYANFPANYLGTTITSLTVTPNNDNSKLDLAAAGTVNMSFMKLFGIYNVSVSATSEITRAAKGMELVLVIDNTGSMLDSAGGGVSKIDAAKTASVTLLNTLYGANNTIENLWVGLVPFSQAVNIGTDKTAWVNAGTHNWGPTSWFGCVEARGATGRDVTDDPPSVELFNKYYHPCHTSTNAWYGTDSDENNCNTGWSLDYNTPLNTHNRGPNLYCPQPMTAMIAEKDTMITAINNMQAVGGTEVPIGLAWAWRMLSPQWRDLWGGQMDTNDLPLDYNTPLMNKVVVLMTDGDNTVYHNVYSAYGYPNTGGQLGASPLPCSSSNCSVGQTRLNQRTTALCNSMKANGILIYTVALGTAVNATSQAMLLGCASKPEYYFLSPTTASLQVAFKQIGDSLANLRISH